MTSTAMMLRVVGGGAQASEGRIPPHDLDAEAACLSSIMIDTMAMSRIADFLAPEHFYAESHARMFEACQALYADGKPIDIVTVGTWLKGRERIGQVGGMAYLTEVLNAAPAVANVRSYAATVYEKWRVRQLIASCQKIAAEGYFDYGNAQKFIEDAEAQVSGLARVEQASTVEQAHTILLRVGAAIQRASERQGCPGTATGFERLDRILDGLPEGTVTLLGARPGMGKSSLALNIAVNVAGSNDADDAGQGVGFFGMEMPREQLMRRAVCSEARVSVTRARAGRLQQADWNRLSEATRHVAQIPLWIDDKPGQSILSLRARIRQMRSEMAHFKMKPCRLKLVVVDYLQLLRGSSDATKQGREAVVSECARGLKGLAMEEGIAILALAQLNRDCEKRPDKRPTLADLRESGELEQAADNIVFIYCEDYYARKKHRGLEPFQGTGVAEAIVAKQRDGGEGLVKLKWEGQYTRFDNLASGEWE